MRISTAAQERGRIRLTDQAGTAKSLHGREVLPDLLEQLRIDGSAVRLFRSLLRIQIESYRLPRRPQRHWIERVEPFGDRVALRKPMYKRERVDRRHLGFAAKRAH